MADGGRDDGEAGDLVPGGTTKPLPFPGSAPSLDEADAADLRRAVATLEQSSLAARLSALLGRQIDFAAQIIPAPVLETVNSATMTALRFALKAAIRSLRGRGPLATARPRLHLAAAALSGAAGGAFGIAALPVELPVSTTIMLRSIADIARSEGEDLDDPETLLACLEVFALGSGNEASPAGDSGYLAMRSLLAKSVSEAGQYIVQRGAIDEAAPALLRFLGQIASRFGVVVGQKAMTQAVPVIGAVTGAAVNAAFTDHFQSLARAHFAVRRLERRYGTDPVRTLFETFRADLRRAAGPTAAGMPSRRRLLGSNAGPGA